MCVCVCMCPAVRAARPRSFLGLSFDLEEIEGLQQRDYIELIKRLASYDAGTVPLRVGAAAADRRTAPWPQSTIEALNVVHKWAGSKLLLGVNMNSEDPAITKSQVDRLKEKLLPGSIETFIVGNEPDM